MQLPQQQAALNFVFAISIASDVVILVHHPHATNFARTRWFVHVVLLDWPRVYSAADIPGTQLPACPVSVFVIRCAGEGEENLLVVAW